MLAHDCTFPEVEILADDEDDNLKAGMKVLTPCSCGETPLDQMDLLNGYLEEFTRTLAQAKPITPLYHWSPASRRKQIIRYGLRPFMRLTTSVGDGEKWRAPVICFADSPSWAWALSGELRWTPSGEWDLWQTDIGRLTDPITLPGEDRLSGVYEVRTEHRVYKRDLWWVGSRIKS